MPNPAIIAAISAVLPTGPERDTVLALLAADTEPEPPVLMTDLAGVARMLGISLRHAARLDAAGGLPMGTKYGRSRRYCIEELNRWIEAGSPHRTQWEAQKSAKKRATR